MQSLSNSFRVEAPTARCAAFDFHLSLMIAGLMISMSCPVAGQDNRKKPKRSKAPVFEKDAMQDIFFDDAASLLKGKLPSSQASVSIDQGGSSANRGESQSTPKTSDDASDPLAWHRLISPTSIEDLIKGSKLRLARIVTTPAAFAGGGFESARQEFSMQSLLFAIIESYPKEDIRFKKSAAYARELMARVAANTKVGSIQTYQEAKKRLLDLEDLVNGSTLSGTARSEVDWSGLVDRSPLMSLLDWAHHEHVSKLSANEAEFESNKEELRRYAELISILGKASIQKEMPDADDDDYVAFAKMMIEQSKKVVVAVETNNPDMARKAAAQIGQRCQDCHDNYQ